MPIIGHGVDIVSVARIRHLLDEHGERFLARVFTDAERDYCLARGGDKGWAGRAVATHLAARFAAKEAVLKALGTGLRDDIAWTDIEVTRGALGEPSVSLTRAAQRAAAARGITTWRLSLSHTDDTAMASVIAE